MVSEETYELCLPILDNEEEEEEKAEKLESFLRDKASLNGSVLENAVLDILWRHRNSTVSRTSTPPLRHTVIRRSSPAPWQMARSSTPLSSPSLAGSSPVAASGFPVPRGGFTRAPKSVTASPFTSPRPSPRLAMVQPIPHSPNLNTYEFSDRTPTPDIYGDYGSDNVDWLVNDDAKSAASSTGLSAAAPEWVAPPDMSPYDILRSVLGEQKSNDEIEQALEINGYDLGATIATLSEQGDTHPAATSGNDGRVLVGKSMAMDQMRPVTPSGPGRNHVVCKYWLSTGQCLRADCKFSHDLTSHLCKYWLMGNCLAGDSCPFSHDPSALVGNLNIGNDSNGNGNIPGVTVGLFQPQDNYEFPALQPAILPDQWQNNYQIKNQPQAMVGNLQNRHNSSPNFRNRGALSQASRSHSRPNSRHQQRDSNPSAPAVDDPEAFPTLAALNVRGQGKKHHGKRGHHREGHKHRDNSAGSMTEVFRMSPSSRRGTPKPHQASPGNSREISAAAQAIPTPKHIPWLETGIQWNQQYLKYRVDAITHGNVRNKFLQSAAQAWNRNDARAAKALSLRGQAENDAMRRCHREAARVLYEEGRKHAHENDDELYVDLHGLLPTEGIEYLDNILKENAQLNRTLTYVITGSGHHSKNGKDKTGKAVKGWLTQCRYVFREFSVPGERGGFVAFVLGVDPTSSERNPSPSKSNNGQKDNGEKNNTAFEAADDSTNGTETAAATTAAPPDSTPVLTMGKVQLLKRENSTKK